MKFIELGVTIFVSRISHNNGKARRIDLGEGKVQMSKTGSDNLTRGNTIAEAIVRVRGLVVTYRSTICGGSVRIARGWRYNLTESKANLAWGQAIWIGVSTMQFIRLSKLSVGRRRLSVGVFGAVEGRISKLKKNQDLLHTIHSENSRDSCHI